MGGRLQQSERFSHIGIASALSTAEDEGRAPGARDARRKSALRDGVMGKGRGEERELPRQGVGAARQAGIDSVRATLPSGGSLVGDEGGGGGGGESGGREEEEAEMDEEEAALMEKFFEYLDIAATEPLPLSVCVFSCI